MVNICKHCPKNAKKFDEMFLKYWGLSGAKSMYLSKSWRSRQELSNEYFVANFGVDTEENEPSKVCSFGWKIREWFDIEFYSDFSSKWSNFIRLVLCCIDAKFCKKIFVGKLLTRSTRFTCFCTAQTSIFQKMFVNFFRIFWQTFVKFRYFWNLFTDFCSD